MKKVNLDTLIPKIYQLENTSMLGVGPMSTNVIQACFELAKDNNFPIMFIASRNQIDLKKYGGGYVNGWDQFEFVDNIKKIAKELDFPHYYICRDHGGPWQRDEERNAHLPIDKAMNIARESFAADIAAGFDLLMVDPTKDPFVAGKTVPMDFVLEKTVELIEFCEQERKKQHVEHLSYEVGTEETNGGLTTTEEYDIFLKKLKIELQKRNLPIPIFAVGQTGTLVKSTAQAGKFNSITAKKLSAMAYSHGVYLKEHNGDYLDDASLVKHIPAKVAAVNVAPQFGTEETRAYLSLCEVERDLNKLGFLNTTSSLKKLLLEESIKTCRWKKWVSEKEQKMSYEEIIKNNKLSNEILEIAGHYTLNNSKIITEKNILFNNLTKGKINGDRFVISRIKVPIQNYIDGLNLKDSLINVLD